MSSDPEPRKMKISPIEAERRGAYESWRSVVEIKES
jgi:hypothetical protein